MKKFIFISFFHFCICSALQAQIRTMQNLIGRWEAVDSENQSGGLEVIDSAKIYLVYGNEKKLVASYEADFSKAPGWFDFTIKDSSSIMSLKSLLHFVNDDLIQWQVFDEAPRPAHFTESDGNMVYLRRKK